MKYCFLLILFLGTSCQAHRDIVGESEPIDDFQTNRIENPMLSIDLTTYLKRFPGVYVSGQGSYASIYIRGINSLIYSNEPLILVDGVQFNSYSELYGAIGTSSIKRIEVLKNPDETGIYGMRGANGVLKITTKK